MKIRLIIKHFLKKFFLNKDYYWGRDLARKIRQQEIREKKYPIKKITYYSNYTL